jgi:branched-chain amino acid transport system permease protein
MTIGPGNILSTTVRTHQTPLLLSLAVAALTLVGMFSGVKAVQVPLAEMLIWLTVVVGLYVFIGNSGIISFGHISFMMIGAYAAAWASAEPDFKQITLLGLPDFLKNDQYSFLTATAGAAGLAAIVAVVVGVPIMRLSGIAATIATFAFLKIVNSVYSNWDSITGGEDTLTSIPTPVGPDIALLFAIAAIFVAYFFQTSRYGLLLRASRDDYVAAKASAVRVNLVRLVAFVISATIVGVGGSLYAHFLGILTADSLFLNETFMTMAMLVVGGIGSLTGAVSGVVLVTIVVQLLRTFERGVAVGDVHLFLPLGSQEIGLGVLMALILIFRPTGITRSREIDWRGLRRRALPSTSRKSVGFDGGERATVDRGRHGSATVSDDA